MLSHGFLRSTKVPLERTSTMGEAAPSELSCFIMGRRTLNLIQHLPKVTAVINSWDYCPLTFLCPWQLCECSTCFYTLYRCIQDIRYIDIHFGSDSGHFQTVPQLQHKALAWTGFPSAPPCTGKAGLVNQLPATHQESSCFRWILSSVL